VYPAPKEVESVLLALSETQLQSITPKSAQKALASPSSVQWLAAMNREKLLRSRRSDEDC
jgi:hypothetical protein